MNEKQSRANSSRVGKQREKFVPNFKKKIPTWKKIDAELKELLPKYDEVCVFLSIYQIESHFV